MHADRESPMESTALKAVLAVLEDNHFRCPAHDYDEPIMCDGVTMESDPLNTDEWVVIHRRQGPLQGSYDEDGRCTEMLEVEMETEYGEMGSVAARYPVVLGNCAPWHGYEDNEGFVYDAVMGRWAERRYLLATSNEAIAAAEVRAGLF
jgi:hypothetical protein